ncbi:MAG: von Willebrand factor type A domain-containing protein [Bacteroidota bacterium]|nr:von Willebrand factor type A domain-containing protein [Bacteroidota bacterium]
MKNTSKVIIVLFVFMLVFFSCGETRQESGRKILSDDNYALESVEEVALDGVKNEDPLGGEPQITPDENPEDFNTEEYDKIVDNPFKDVKQNPLSTFSIDVDNAAYSNVRRFLNNNSMPPPNAVRIEEMINYFSYDYPDATGKHPFTFVTELSDCPWNTENKLMHIGIQGKKLNYDEFKPSNLVLLLDVSGSMDTDNKLPLLKKSLLLLLDELDDRDMISIVVYAGAAGLILEPTPATEKRTVKRALNRLEAGGSTAGGAGIHLAYKQAKKAFIPGGNNRIILATDGDFNVGTSATGSLVDLISEKRKEGIYLTILGLGMGNYKDGRMEQISNAGNGNYFYIDNIKEAEKVFKKELRANMFTIAKDVKIQIEFNPTMAKAYRLIGYENRLLAKEDFDDDTKDAGELGAGHTVTALYEIIPTGSATEVNTASDLKYQETKIKKGAKTGGEIMTLKFRYKPIDKEKSILIEEAVPYRLVAENKRSENFNFSASVASFGMILRGSEHKGSSTYSMAKALAKAGKGKDPNDYRAEYIRLIEMAELLDNN